MAIAIVNFRTLANGSYKYMAGKRRGYWRVLLVRDINGPTKIDSHNVVAQVYASPDGIDGVTDRSAYCLEAYKAEAARIAAKLNAETMAASLVRAHTPAGLPC